MFPQNRLELYYDSVLVSLEQAYALLLNNRDDDKAHEKYFIFSNLSKAGYNVQPHRRYIQVSAGSSTQSWWSRDIATGDKCVWRCLLENLNQPCSSNDVGQEADDEMYLKIQQNMKTIEESIKSQCSQSLGDLSDDSADSWQSAIATVKGRRKESSRKRKIEPSTSKKMKSLERTTNHFLDVLTHEQDVCNFRKIFAEIQVIQLDRTQYDNTEEATIESDHIDVEFDFDLYLTRPNFKQSDPGVPNFRILIFKSNENAPTRELIVKAFRKPAVRAPVLVFYINELMRVSAFLYRISL